MKQYLREKLWGVLCGAAILISINLYFYVLCAASIYLDDLLYLDGIFLAIGILYFAVDYLRWKKIPGLLKVEILGNKENAEKLLGRQTADLLCRLEQENKEELDTLMDSMDGMSDYITRWAHEVKLPLSALKLMNERNQDSKLAKEMQNCLERIQQLLNTMLMSSKLKRMENDVLHEKVELTEAVNEVLRNQSYFLIREHFQIKKELDGFAVYSDRRWLVYILDQLVGNAVKYRSNEPVLVFGAKQVSQGESVLTVEDNGIGMKEEEIPYIFDRGYIGSNLRDGDYRSTGMGLYFVEETARRLEIRIQVWSKPGEGTRFELHFYNNAEYFNM